MRTKVWSIKKKSISWKLSKLKTSYLQRAIKSMKKKKKEPQSGFMGEPRAWAWEKMFATYISVKEML